jgi:hypothetical protein
MKKKSKQNSKGNMNLTSQIQNSNESILSN